MRRFVIVMSVVLMAAVALAKPERLNNFEELMGALKGGQSVRVVAEYKKMTLALDGKVIDAPDAIGGMKVDSWEWFAKGVVRNEKPYVAFSHTVLIAHPSYGHVYNYVRFRVYEGNEVEVTAQYLQTEDHKVVMDETFRGKIFDGKNGAGVSFFATE